MTRLRRPLVLTAVAAAFADSSIVVLAIPELLGEFDLGVTGASWVITAYNVAVVVTGAALIPAVARIRTARLAGIGFAAFALASAGCAAATSFGLLVGFRAAQGAAAGLVLVAALPLLGGRPGVRAWTLAATIGLAAGPALGGLLTELFSWRSIFVAQAPLVALGLLALRGGAVVTHDPETETRVGFRRANAALAALSAALVGALFLVVVLLINGLGWQPLPAALVATTLPVLAALAEPFGRALPARAAAASGGLLVASGLVVLGLLPGARTDLIVAGLALCGAGLGLAAQPLGSLSLPGPRLTRDAAWTVVARHAGLVLALVVVTPILVSSLTELERDAETVGGELVFQAELPLETKVPVLVDLAAAAEAVDARLPDFREVLEPYGAGEAAGLAGRLSDQLEDLSARAFREPFLACAGFGLLAALIALALPGRGRARAPAVAFVVLALAGAVAAVSAELVSGARDDPTASADPCDAPASGDGEGTGETVERVTLGAIAAAACELETSRASLLRALTGTGEAPWSDDELTLAIRTGIVDAIEAERELGTISAETAGLLRVLAAAAPLDWLRDALRGERG